MSLSNQLRPDPIELDRSELLCHYLSESSCIELYSTYLNVKYPEDLEDDANVEVESAWVHLNLGVLGMLENLANSTLEPKFPLFSVYWNQNPTDPESFLEQVNPETEEEFEVLDDNKKGMVLYRIQNFFMNLAYRGLHYYYSTKNIDFEEKEVMVHFEGEGAFEAAQEFVNIEDMSFFMLEILKHDVQKFKKKVVKKLTNKSSESSGCVVVLKHLSFPEGDYTAIPAYLPTYLIQLDEEADLEEEEDTTPKKKSKKNKK